tara:strand:+ start:4009 stop:4857 length:849 start_codon:yes stop_codon:yes gene_type:complete
MLYISKLNNKIYENFQIGNSWLILPFIFLLTGFIVFYILYIEGGSFIDGYINSQKEVFLCWNSFLSNYSNVQINLTQLGDVLIVYSFLAVLLYYAPIFWEYLFTSSLLTLVVSAALKKIFAVPRPAAILDIDKFTVLGKTLTGHTSFPSGHSIVIFVVVTLLMIAFIPKKRFIKIIWGTSLIIAGLIISLSRVGVGAHYPMDIVFGGIVGFLVAIIGIVLTNKFRLWKRIKRVPFFIIIGLIIWGAVIITKILDNNLLIFYFALISIIITLVIFSREFFKKN